VIALPGFEDVNPSAAEIAKEASETKRRLTFTKASDVKVRAVRYLWEGRIPLSAMTIMPGEEGVGKTTVGIRLMADLTNGTLEGDYKGQPRSVIVIAPEDDVASVMAPRSQCARADMDKVIIVSGVFDPVVEGESSYDVTLPRDLPQLGDLVQEHDVAMVWIDSLVTTLPPDAKTISYQDVNRVIRPLNVFAQEHDIAVVAPWHLNKSSGNDSASRMMDSRALRTATRSVLFVVAAESESGCTEGLVVLDKANSGPLQVPALRYRIESVEYPVPDDVYGMPGSCGVVEWVGIEPGDGRALVREALSPQGPRSESPGVIWLRAYLEANGETERQQVLRDGLSELGFSERLLDRAAHTLGVTKTESKGHHEVGGTPWRKTHWSLAVQTSVP
jgi:hypothetical protein